MKVYSGKSTYIGYIFAFLAFLTAFIGKLSNNELPLDVDPVLLMQVGAGVAIATFLGRAAQAVWGQRPVSWGLGSSVTFGLAALTGLLAFLAEVGDEALLLGVPPESMVKLSGILTTALVAGRMLQSAFGAAVAEEDDRPFFPPVVVEPVDAVDDHGDTPAPPDDAPSL